MLLNEKKINLTSLTALVFSSMVGVGIFNLPKNMAEVASLKAIIIGWIITSIGILFFLLSLLLLLKIRPDLNRGICSYAKEGFGKFFGFCSAWGYWLCSLISNAAYLMIIFISLGFFTDHSNEIIFGSGNTWQSLIGESLLLWITHLLILQGTNTAAYFNKLITFIKFIPIILFIILSILHFKIEIFQFNFYCKTKIEIPILEQIKNTMMITLWGFIGIEGAMTISNHTTTQKNVKLATLFALILSLSIYVLVTLLSFGIIDAKELENIRNPSMAPLMINLMGKYGELIIIGGLIISVCGSYLSWTIMAIEIPYEASIQKIFPEIFKYKNKNEVPYKSLFFTNIFVQLILILVFLNKNDYKILLTISSEMILVPYFLVGAFLTKISLNIKNKKITIVGIGSSIYGIWLFYSSEIIDLILSLILYILGTLIFFSYKKNINTI